MRAAIYARVSTEKQATNYSLPSQLEACRQYCVGKGYTIAAEYREVFSGAELNRPKLDLLRNAARDGQYDVIVTLDMDRWSRGDQVERYITDDEFKRYHAPVEYVLEQFDSSPEGELQKQIRGIIAEYERKKFIQRAKRGRKTYVESGHVVRGRVDKYGYRYVDKYEGNSNLEIVPEEAEIVRLIYQWYVSGDENGRKLGQWAIAQKLTQMGVPTRYDKDSKEAERSHKIRPVGGWASIAISRILADEAYAGVFWYGKRTRVKDEKTGKKRLVQTPQSEWIPVKVPAIVSRELWKAARDQAQKNEKNSARNSKYPFLLSGLTRCSTCEGRFYGSHSHGAPIYRCKGTSSEKWAKPTPTRCYGRIRADILEPLVWDTAKDLLKNPDRIAKSMREKQSEFKPQIQILQEQLESVNRKLAEIENAQERLIDLYLLQNSKLSPERLARRDADLKQQFDQANTRRIELENQLQSTVIPENALQEVLIACEQVQQGIDYFDQADKRKILELLKVSVLVQWGKDGEDDTVLITGYFPTVTVKLHREIAHQTDSHSY